MTRNIVGVHGRDRASSVRASLIFGLVIIAVGVLFTLDNLGIVEAGTVLRWWNLLLIAYGLARLTGLGCRRNYTVGWLFTIGGLWFMLHDLGFIHGNVWNLWPVVLIVIGASMVARAFSRHTSETACEDQSPRLSAFAIMSSTARKVVAQDFRSGEVIAIMGGHEINLRGARMAGDTAVIDLFVWMGGVDIIVPEDWRVSSQMVPIMGGIEDNTKPPVGEVRGHLILKGAIMLGGVEIKN